MRTPSKRPAALVHPDRLPLLGGPQPTPCGVTDTVGRAILSPDRSTPHGAEQRTPAVPSAAQSVTTSEGLKEDPKTPGPPIRSVDPLADAVDAPPCKAMPTCRSAHSPASESLGQSRFTLDTLWQAVRLVRMYQGSSAAPAEHQALRDEPPPAAVGRQPATPGTRAGTNNRHPGRRPATGRPAPRPDGPRAVPRLEGDDKP